MSAVVRFLFGAVLGSFLNVLALRYNPEKFLLHPNVIGGRSRCPHCGKTLRFYELIPLVSFVIQRGRCRGCGARLGLQYPLAEFVSGLVVALVPPAVSRLPQFEFLGAQPAIVYATVVLWTLVFLTLILITLIDVRLKLIPDELNVFLCVLGLALAFFGANAFGGVDGSFLGSYALLFGFRGNIWENRAMAVAFAAVFFGAIILFTRGKAMGFGDLKLGVALGLVIGWADVALLFVLAFVLGALMGVAAIVLGKATLRGFLPFGPFLAAAAALVFFFGPEIMRFYFSLFPIV